MDLGLIQILINSLKLRVKIYMNSLKFQNVI